jgi:hypothetical protein
MVLPGTYTTKLTVGGSSYTQPLVIVPDPRVHASPAALAAQFRLQQRMVAGLTASYQAFNYVTQLRSVLDSSVGRARNAAGAAEISARAKSLDSALSSLATTGFGIVHRDLGRRYSDQFIADAMPTPSVVAGVDAPCKQLDETLDRLRVLQRTDIAELNGLLARAAIGALPSWLPPASPACAPPTTASLEHAGRRTDARIPQ